MLEDSSVATLEAEAAACEAIIPLIRRLGATAPGSDAQRDVVYALAALGPPAARALLECYGEAKHIDTLRLCFAEALSMCEARDERIYAILLDALRFDPFFGAGYLAQYGDPRAIAALEQAFDAAPIPEDGGLFATETVMEIRLAILGLGGTLTAEREAKWRQIQSLRRSNNRGP
jgi:hypothetical protein